MVSSRHNYQPAPEDDRKTKGTFVKLSEVLNSGSRLEASAYDAASRNARTKIKQYHSGFLPLHGSQDCPIVDAHNAFRFKRIYTSEDFGVPFVSSSSIIDIDVSIDKFISKKLTRNLDNLIIKRGEILISCSGTIGNIGFAGSHLAGKACSQHVIRATAKSIAVGGFIAAFLRGKFGRCQLTRSTYGSVVQHIEPEHLKTVIVPSFATEVQDQIGSKFVGALEARDQALDCLDKARALLNSSLGLSNRQTTEKKAHSETVKLSQLKGRFEAGFHSANALDVERWIEQGQTDFLSIGSEEFSTKVHAVTKFRKRVYVKGDGIPLYSSKSIFQIDPIEIKKLGRGIHTKDMDEIGLKSGMILVTCSGTIGNVLPVCDYMDGWAVNQHAIRLHSTKPELNSLLYAWLSSEPGNLLVKRNSYGSVILEIDRWMVAGILAPHPDQVPTEEIHALVSNANRLRTKAWNLEQEAISEIEDRIESNF